MNTSDTSHASTRRGHVVLADDDPAVLHALTLLLRPTGHIVTSVTTPERALAILASRSVDLLITDMNFSKGATAGEDGRRLLKGMAGLRQQPPVIVLTAWREHESARDHLLSGVVACVLKPWDDVELLALIREALTISRSNAWSSDPRDEQSL